MSTALKPLPVVVGAVSHGAAAAVSGAAHTAASGVSLVGPWRLVAILAGVNGMLLLLSILRRRRVAAD